MPTRAELRALAERLRHAQTRLLPLELAERIQHAIVRLEEALDAATPPAVDEARRAVDDGEQLLALCAALRSPP